MSGFLEVELRRIVRQTIEDALAEHDTAPPPPRPVQADVPMAARLMCCSQDTVRSLIRRGVLPTVDVGINRVLIPVAAIEALPTSTPEVRCSATTASGPENGPETSASSTPTSGVIHGGAA